MARSDAKDGYAAGEEVNMDPKPLSHEWVERELAICGKATDGPWRMSSSGYSIRTDADCANTKDGPPINQIVATVQCCKDATHAAVKRFQDDGDFIAAARTGYPLVLEALRERGKPEEHHCLCCSKGDYTP
jgi:hypothetical protein